MNSTIYLPKIYIESNLFEFCILYVFLLCHWFLLIHRWWHFSVCTTTAPKLCIQWRRMTYKETHRIIETLRIRYICYFDSQSIEIWFSNYSQKNYIGLFLNEQKFKLFFIQCLLIFEIEIIVPTNHVLYASTVEYRRGCILRHFVSSQYIDASIWFSYLCLAHKSNFVLFNKSLIQMRRCQLFEMKRKSLDVIFNQGISSKTDYSK